MAIASRKLLGAKGLNEMIMSTAPIIIIFILFLGDGKGGAEGIIPAICWLLGLIFIAAPATWAIYKMFGKKIIKNKNLWEYNSATLDCEILNIRFGNDVNIPFRLVFYGYTLAYLITHAVFGSAAEPSMFVMANMIAVLAIIILLSGADILRLIDKKCYIDNNNSSFTQIIGKYILSGLGIGILTGVVCGFFFGNIGLEDTLAFFIENDT